MNDEARQKREANAEQISDQINDLEKIGIERHYGRFWVAVKEINVLFRLPLFPNDNKRLRETMQSIIEETQARWKEEEEAAEKQITEALDELEPLAEQKKYKDFWQKTKEISSMFKNASLSRESREQLWDCFHNLCHKVKEVRKDIESKSEFNRYHIIEKIKHAKSTISSAYEPEDFLQARKILDEVMIQLKETKLIKSNQDECWEEYRNASQSLREKREKRQGKDYGELRSDITTIRENTLGHWKTSNTGIVAFSMGAAVGMIAPDEARPHEALKLIKEAQEKLRSSFLTKDQRYEIREDLQGLWDEAIQVIESEKEAKRQKHEEWVEKQQAWRNMMEEKVERLEALLEKNEGIIERLEEQIEDLEEKIENAYNEGWADDARGWVQEKQDKIADIQKTNEELEEKIKEIRKKLDDE
ncbi:MAG: hypothetical protein Q8R40_02865 [bacterium]|nr:hypothetical protein [bacterium]